MKEKDKTNILMYLMSMTMIKPIKHDKAGRTRKKHEDRDWENIRDLKLATLMSFIIQVNPSLVKIH